MLDPHPRLVKMVRDGIGKFLGTSEVAYVPVPREQAVIGLRKKLVEEAAEYLMDPSLGELADVLEVVRALAIHDLGVSLNHVTVEAQAKRDERGGFEQRTAMFVYSTAPARHEGEHADAPAQ